jgi:hypothetical protein
MRIATTMDGEVEGRVPRFCRLWSETSLCVVTGARFLSTAPKYYTGLFGCHVQLTKKLAILTQGKGNKHQCKYPDRRSIQGTHENSLQNAPASYPQSPATTHRSVAKTLAASLADGPFRPSFGPMNPMLFRSASRGRLPTV